MSGERLLRIPYDPHPFQAVLHAAPHTIKAGICGARSGKTLSFAAECAMNCIEQPGFSREMAASGLTYDVAIGAPTYRMIRRNILRIFTSMIPREIVVGRYHQTENILRLRGQYGLTVVNFLSATNPESWEGQDLFGVWLDEFAQMKELMFHEAQVRLSNRRGWLLMSGTPKGPTWVKRQVYDYARSPQGKGKIFCITWKTSDNPTFPKDMLEKERAMLPARFFRRMYEASLESFQGQIYEEFTTERNVRPRSKYRFLLPDGRRTMGIGSTEVRLVHLVAGVDWGYSTPGSIVVVGTSDTGQRFVLDLEYETGIEVVSEDPTQDTWLKRAQVLNAEWGIETFFCGQDQPGNISSFKRGGLNAMAADVSVEVGIMSVASAMKGTMAEGESMLVILSDLEALLEEVQQYHWEEDSDGNPTGRPEKVNDHACDGLRYAVYSTVRRKRFRREPNYRKGEVA